MATVWTYHRPLLDRMAEGGTDWEDLTLLLVPWHEDAAFTPSADDEILATYDPPSNALEAGIGAEDPTSIRVSFEGGVAWDSPLLELLGDDVDLGALVSGHAGHGISGFSVCQQVGDGLTDATQILLATAILADPTELTGGAVTVVWNDGVIAEVGPEDP